uniref:uncharacterized protein LOC122601297 n=1 Tax=Erigeron canadensis TaxID=72917 RepID=UPI001CB9C9DF|nr:uncharacterized protein LOC122601297 [Erigeron canadensis]
MSWGWRKILQQRHTIRPLLKHKIGDGRSMSMWYDNWSDIGPLINFISTREIYRAGFSMTNKFADLIDNGVWRWPVAWYDLFPVLIDCTVPTLNNDKNDRLILRTLEGVELDYSTANVWELMRYKRHPVLWVELVWFSSCIPRHSFLLWMVMNKKLQTQDRLKPWEVGGAVNLNLVCYSLCKTGRDSHDHLFFECAFATQVWNLVRDMANMHDIPAKLKDISDHLIPLARSKSANSIIGKLIFAATTYFVWQERNNQMFINDTRSPAQLKNTILDTVRYKIVTVKFRGHNDTKVLEKWNLASQDIRA